jgi:osmotically-inducible protein OsmY
MSTRVWAFRWIFVVAACAAACSACVAVVGAAAVSGAITVTDRRSFGMQVEDKEIEHRINSAIADRFARQSVRIDVSSYNQKVLLAGTVSTEKDRRDVEAIAASSQNVMHVVDQLAIGSLAGLNGTASDNLLETKVTATFISVRGLDAGAIKVSCTDGSVYLMGRVSEEEADLAERASRRIDGVKRVVALFDILTDAEMAPYRPKPDAAKTAANSAPAPNAASH